MSAYKVFVLSYGNNIHRDGDTEEETPSQFASKPSVTWFSVRIQKPDATPLVVVVVVVVVVHVGVIAAELC